MKLAALIKKDPIIFCALLMLLLVVTNTGLIFYTNHTLVENTRLKNQTEQIRSLNEDVWHEIVRNMDIGFRGFVITQDTSLLSPYTSSCRKKEPVFAQLTTLLQQQGYDDLAGLLQVRQEVDNYQQGCAQMIDLVVGNQLETVKQLVKQDRGKTLWAVYSRFTAHLESFETNLNQQAESQYKAATHQIAFMQALLALIGLPSLLFMIVRIREDKRKKHALLAELEKNNRAYLFDSGQPLQVSNEQELINGSINNFKKAAEFIQQITQGNYEVEWLELTQANRQLNQTNLTGALLLMREQMKLQKTEEEKRLWHTEGLTQLNESIRLNQHQIQTLCTDVVAFLVKYLKAQQGGLFLLQEDPEKHLELMGCYAFDRKKYVSKRIEIGQGLIGQAYLEGESTVLSQLPPRYTSITSGLGEATPSSIAIIPFCYNDQVLALLELAAFHVFEPYQITFLEKAGEYIAASVAAAQSSEKMMQLLETSQQQAEQMRAQEEEMRQNMEEMQATQEEMQRLLREVQQKEQ